MEDIYLLLDLADPQARREPSQRDAQSVVIGKE